MRIIGEKECKNWCPGGHLGDYCNIPNGDTEEFKWGSHDKQGKQKYDIEHLIKKKKNREDWFHVWVEEEGKVEWSQVCESVSAVIKWMALAWLVNKGKETSLRVKQGGVNR